jgi:hypothetical protein
MHEAFIQRKCVDGVPIVGWPHQGQQKILDMVLSHLGGVVLFLHALCGRGWGKSTVGIDLAVALLNRGPDEVGLFLEPDVPTVNETFLQEWSRVVPDHLYEINESKRKITWYNRAVLYYAPRAITGSKHRIANRFRGRNLTFVIDDEAAQGFDRRQFTTTQMCVRTRSSAGTLVYVTLSTPVIGPYVNMIREAGHILVNCPSTENPYLDPILIQQWRDTMSRQEYEREVLAMIQSLTGRLWADVDLDHAWPDGNLDLDWPRFVPGEPFWIGCDIGSATGAFVIIQRAPPRWGEDLPRWVIVADLCPQTEGNVRRAFGIIKEHFGTPAGISAGADIDTANSVTGTSAAYFAEKIFGSIPIYPCSERTFAKQLQYDSTTALFCTATGRRRLTVAKDFVSLDPGSHRGILEMIKEDCWLDQDKRRPGDVLPKNREILVQHIRDALMMCVTMVMKTPEWDYDGDVV